MAGFGRALGLRSAPYASLTRRMFSEGTDQMGQEKERQDE